MNLPSNIMWDNMLVTPSGLPGHAMGIDLNIEPLIHHLKVIALHDIQPQITYLIQCIHQGLSTTKGICLNWDQLGNMLPVSITSNL